MDKSGRKLSRRTLFAGASGVGAVVAAASLIPGLGPSAAPDARPKAAPAKGGGYSLSEHVKRYYRSTVL